MKPEYILHDIEVYKKRLKRLRINVKSRTSTIYRDIMPKVYKHGGRLVGGLSAGLIAFDAKSSGGFKVSHAIDVTVIGLAFVTGGWMVGVLYFAIDLLVLHYTYRTTGHAKSIGDYINDLVEYGFGIENGIIWRLD